MRKPARTTRSAARPRQRGTAMIIFVIGLVAIIGVAGLALDTGHAMLNKTRLQNIVDAAALSGAKTLDDTGNTAVARDDALAMFEGNAAGQGNREIGDAYAAGSLVVTVEFSSTLNPFVPGTSPAEYVRVRAENFTMPAWFSSVLGINEKGVAARAVAGPSPTINQACNIMPMMVCGDPAAGPPYWGYTPNEPDVLKSSSNGGDFEVGPGNFQLIRLGDGQGGDVVREAMAGSYDACFTTGDVIETEPGNTVGPVVQGLNTRFGEHIGPLTGTEDIYPPDVVTEQPVPPLGYESATDQITYEGVPITDTSTIFGHDTYSTRVGNLDFDEPPAPNGDGAFHRREVAIAIGDCSVATTGQGQLPLLGFGCFFLLQQAEQKGNESQVFGEFIRNCRSGGMPGPSPTTVPGPYIIQLYRDFGSTDS